MEHTCTLYLVCLLYFFPRVSPPPALLMRLTFFFVEKLGQLSITVIFNWLWKHFIGGVGDAQFSGGFHSQYRLELCLYWWEPGFDHNSSFSTQMCIECLLCAHLVSKARDTEAWCFAVKTDKMKINSQGWTNHISQVTFIKCIQDVD